MPDLQPLSPIADQPLSVVLLASREPTDTETVVGEWVTLCNGLDRDYELILTDDGLSAETLDALTARFKRLQVVRLEPPGGAGAGLRTALTVASRPLLFYTTCDRQFQPADIKKLLPEMDKVHLMSGYRLGRTVPAWLRPVGVSYRLLMRVLFGFAPTPLPAWLGYREHAYRLLIRVLFGVRCHDVQCAFRLFRREVFDRMPIQSHGTFVHTEILAKANFLGCYMNDEAPIAHRPLLSVDADPHFWSDFNRVLSRPSFGPVVSVVPQPPAEPATSSEQLG